MFLMQTFPFEGQLRSDLQIEVETLKAQLLLLGKEEASDLQGFFQIRKTEKIKCVASLSNADR